MNDFWLTYIEFLTRIRAAIFISSYCTYISIYAFKILTDLNSNCNSIFQMGLKINPNKDTYTITQIENDLKALHDFCKQNNLSQDDMEKIFQPLITNSENTILFRKCRVLAIIIITILFLYSLSYIEFFSWHYSAIGRIAMIKMLPFWDWQHLKNERCLIKNTFINFEQEYQPVECTFCESIDTIPVEFTLDPETINKRYISLDMPVVLVDSFNIWPVSNISNISELISMIRDDDYSKSYPCKLSSNIHNSEENVYQLLNKAELFDKYFIHFQNCDFSAVKDFRRFAPRPEFLIPEISPVQYSWLLANRNYHVEKYKTIRLKEKIAIVAQIFGSTLFKVSPISDCKGDCPVLEISLNSGESLIVTALWNLQYLPIPETENLAVILEVH